MRSLACKTSLMENKPSIATSFNKANIHECNGCKLIKQMVAVNTLSSDRGKEEPS